MSPFESSFVDTVKHLSNPDNEASLPLDIKHPIDEDDTIDNEDDNDPPIEHDPDTFDNILYDWFCPSVVIDNSRGTLTIREAIDDAIFYECKAVAHALQEHVCTHGGWAQKLSWDRYCTRIIFALLVWKN